MDFRYLYTSFEGRISGYPEYDMSYWFGVIAPASTPDDLVEKVNELITTATASERVSELFLSTGTEAVPVSADEFGEILSRERDQLGALVLSSGMLEQQ